MNTEQLQQILLNAPDGTTHVEVDVRGNEYWQYNRDLEQLLWWSYNPSTQDSEWSYQKVDSDSIADFHSLSDIKEIVELRSANKDFREMLTDATASSVVNAAKIVNAIDVLNDEDNDNSAWEALQILKGEM